MQQFQSVTTNSQKNSKEELQDIQKPSPRPTETDDKHYETGQNFYLSILAVIESDVKLNNVNKRYFEKLSKGRTELINMSSLNNSQQY